MPNETMNTISTADATIQSTAQETNQTTPTTDYNTGTNSAANGQAAQPERTFTQADVDRMIADRLSRERRQHQQDIENARTEARTEAEQLAQMTAEQRAQRERERADQAARQREQQLAEREAVITRRELRAQAIDTLLSRDLPHELESVLDYSSADACNASIDNVEKVFRAAVQAGVDARLKASGVKLPAPGSSDGALMAQVRQAMGLGDNK